MIHRIIIFVSLIWLLVISSACTELHKSSFSFEESEQGVELLENDKPVFFYQEKPKSLTGEYICNNYLHPVYNIKGDTLTEEFPPDHQYHRGIFWAWHQLYVDTVSLGDGWINDGISQDVINVKKDISKSQAQINLEVMWQSSTFQEGRPFLNEHTTITVYPIESDIRKIDFEIVLRPLIQGFQIGGSADEKGYGGLCARVKLPDGLIFTSSEGPVTPQNLQIEAGPWMDFSANFGNTSEVSGLTILCHPTSPGYPENWILRQKTSMQNIVYPGQERVSVKMDKPLILRYRIIIHEGGADIQKISELQADYEKMFRTE